MRISTAIIGGTGIGSRFEQMPGYAVHIPTPFGIAKCRVIEHSSKEVAIFSRHSAAHSTPPHKVNYRALALAAKALGVQVCLSSAAVGGLHSNWPVGTFCVCSDFLDLTGRNLTLFDRQVVHTDFSTPFDKAARSTLISASKEQQAHLREESVYVNGNGPRYETPFEISLYRELGGDIVGMTAASEAIAMKEAGVPYACLAIVTNFACGIQEAALSHAEVVQAMEQNGEKAVTILLEAATNFEA